MNNKGRPTRQIQLTASADLRKIIEQNSMYFPSIPSKGF